MQKNTERFLRFRSGKGKKKMNQYFPEGVLVKSSENKAAVSSEQSLREAMNEGMILEAYVTMCTSSHDLIVDLGEVIGVIPREEGALGIKEGTVRDIAVISRVNRAVCFIITDIDTLPDGTVKATLSRAAAQRRCMEDFIARLAPGDVIDASITHLEHFGAFADIGCGIPSLIPIDSMSVSRIEHPSQRFAVGESVKAVVRSVDGGRVCLSHKELLGTWEENAACFEIGQTVTGIVRSVESYGAFVELAPNLAGLAELKDGIETGMRVSVYIKNIIPSKMKIKLIIIDAFNESVRPASPKYFFEGNKMVHFRYSPEGCEKVIETRFE